MKHMCRYSKARLHGGGGPQISCKRDQIKMRDCMDRQVTPPTWGSPPPYKQALR